jgi:predicted RNA methylase
MVIHKTRRKTITYNKTKKSGLKRNTIDKFYTKPYIAQKCVDIFSKYITLSSNDVIIEPSAGNGSFIVPINQVTENSLFFDLKPENSSIIKQNFFDLDTTQIIDKYDNIHTIGNPPFGRQSSLAIQFINKAATFSDSISFILPRSFKKPSMKKSFPLNFHLIYQMDLPKNSFLLDGIQHDVPCIFQIWKRRSSDRAPPKKFEPKGYEFINKSNNPHICFRRIGVNAGAIKDDISQCSENSHYFIRFTNNKKIEDNIDSISKLQFQFNNTVGPKSISKPELISRLNRILNI